jgi:DNA helicase II / ATP-dependent DNA helicase PcrA
MATIRCGHCGGTHATVAEARVCAGAGAGPATAAPAPPAAPAPGPPAAAVPNLPADPVRLAGPDLLGRNAVVRPGQAVPAPWASAPRLAVVPGAPVSDELVARWYSRQRTVIELAGVSESAAAARSLTGPVWRHPPTRLVDADVVEHVVWSNSIDLRDPRHPSYQWRDAALAAGASPGGPADVLLPDGTPAWCDGGPVEISACVDIERRGARLVHRIALERGLLTPLGRGPRVAPELAPDQRAAVTHERGAVRVIAPAGSGKTRVLTERARELVTVWRVPASATCLVAFNERAAAEMRERTADLAGLHVRTLNALGLAVLDGRPPFAPRGPRHQVLDERAVRDVLAGLVTMPRRRNTDPLAAWIDALAEVRLTLRDPSDVEADYDGEVDGLPEVLERYREILRQRHAVDFDEQIAAAIEVLLAEPATRSAAQRACRLLLVDEFQDLAPAHLLMVRLLASPELAVFGVGDDDQTIYGFAGATPDWLIRYASLFPSAGDHPLQVNYRCPPAVVDAARTLLARNRRRVPKEIRSAPGRAGVDGALRIRLVGEPGSNPGTAPDAAGGTTSATADAVADALAAGAAPADIAVLTRVNATLAPVQLVLRHRGIAVQRAIDERWIDRTGVRSALAWLRLAVDPAHLRGPDLREAARRPARGRSAKLVEWIAEQHSLAALSRLAGRLGERDAEKVTQLVDDVTRLAGLAAAGVGDTTALLLLIRELGLDESMGALDGYQRTPKQSGHLDDLDALVALGDLCPDPARFPAWLHEELRAPGDTAGVRLATVHRVKGREWPHVVVHHAGAEQMPHRLAVDVEEERRVFHVAITRCSVTCTVVAPAASPSPFLAELRGEAPDMRPIRSRAPSKPMTSAGALIGAPGPPDAALLQDLKAWRAGRARADGMPAYVVFHDATLEEIARRRPATLPELARVKGLGPTKLERYGDDVLALVAARPDG